MDIFVEGLWSMHKLFATFLACLVLDKNKHKVSARLSENTEKVGFFGLFIFLNVIQCCSTCLPSDSTIAEGAVIEPGLLQLWH
jgi:hypothetical protein